MSSNYFIYNNVKYIIEYNNEKIIIFKEDNNKKELLSEEENTKIKKLLNSKYSYIYNSSIINNLVYQNDNIEKKEYIINMLNWLERIIPQECRNNLYRNLKTLRTELNANVNLDKLEKSTTRYSTSGGYNTKSNMIVISSAALVGLWDIAKRTNNPQDFYSRHYSQNLLHELVHMASSNYNYETNVSLCGFDVYPALYENDKNRGLTEGFTEIISMAGYPNTVEISSKYYIEECIINQLIQLIGTETVIRSFFSNLGVMPLQLELNKLIDNQEKAYNLFRNIECNYTIRDLAAEQNILGNIQSSLLDYLEVKLDMMVQYSSIEEISDTLKTYEAMLITPNVLKKIGLNPQAYYGLTESVNKFDAIKTKCLLNLRDNKKSSL